MVCRTEFFLFVEKKLTIGFFGVKFTEDYHNVAIIPTLFRDHRQKSKKPIFSSFFLLLTVITWLLCNDSNDMVIPGKFLPKKLYESVKFWEKKIVDSRKGSQVRSQNREKDHFGMSDGIFFLCGKKSWSYCFLAWNLPEITIMLQLFKHYSGITDKSRKNRFFHRFYYLWPWSRNNYSKMPKTW